MPSQYDDPHGRYPNGAEGKDPWHAASQGRHPAQGAPTGPERRVYRSTGRMGGEDAGPMQHGPTRHRPRRDERRARLVAVIVLVLVVLVIVLVGVAAGDSGSQSTDGTFRLLPITTTT